MEKISYGGWKNCIRLENGRIELIATTDVGPRIIRFGFVGGMNLFKEFPQEMGKTGGSAWRAYGGHRLWHAPESMPRSYQPDNRFVRFTWEGNILKLSQPLEVCTGIEKEVEVSLEEPGNHVKVLHRVTNRNLWDVRLAPWCITAMAPGGCAIFPQEPYGSHPQFLLPARALVLWQYTDMSDERWTWGKRYIILRQVAGDVSSQKAGMSCTQGWAAYNLEGCLFLKRFSFQAQATYPDMGCNVETFTNGEMLELETLGPLTLLPATGGSLEYIEHWFLFEATLGEEEDSLDKTLLPLVRETDSLVNF